MKVILVNKDFSGGGAASACRRLFFGLSKRKELNVKLLVQNYNSSNENIISIFKSFGKYRALCNLIIEKIHFLFFEASSKVRFAFSSGINGSSIVNIKEIYDADIIHIHWFNQGFLSLKSFEKILKLNKPVIWTMHDMWPFTGGCHHSFGCNNYWENCGNCKYLKRPSASDLSFRILKKKKSFFNHSNLHFVAVSDWHRNKFLRSSLGKNFTCDTIYNPLDTNLFIPKDKKKSREIWNLPQDKILILFAANRIDDPVKGFNYLLKALKVIIDTNQQSNIELVLLGRLKYEFYSPVSFHILGTITDESVLPSLYSAVDLTISTSEFETFGQVLTESMACETPVVAFNYSGPAEIIEHKINGYLAEYLNINDLVSGILWCLNEASLPELKSNSRKRIVEHFSEEIISNQYVKLYKKLLNKETEI